MPLRNPWTAALRALLLAAATHPKVTALNARNGRDFFTCTIWSNFTAQDWIEQKTVSIGVRRNSDTKTITLYLHGVFADYPELRPDGESEVKVTRHPSGKAALINLASGGLGRRRIKRDSSDGAGPSLRKPKRGKISFEVTKYQIVHKYLSLSHIMQLYDFLERKGVRSAENQESH